MLYEKIYVLYSKSGDRNCEFSRNRKTQSNGIHTTLTHLHKCSHLKAQAKKFIIFRKSCCELSKCKDKCSRRAPNMANNNVETHCSCARH